MFNCNGIEWYIRFVSPRSSHLIRNDGTLTIGMTDGYNHIIYIANNSLGIRNYDILSRDFEGIIEECQEITAKYFLSVSDELCKNIRSGYRNKK